MQKEKKIKTYQRKTKSGKVTTVRQHTAKYTAADMANEALKHAKGAGGELEKKKLGSKEDISLIREELEKFYSSIDVRHIEGLLEAANIKFLGKSKKEKVALILKDSEKMNGKNPKNWSRELEEAKIAIKRHTQKYGKKVGYDINPDIDPLSGEKVKPVPSMVIKGRKARDKTIYKEEKSSSPISSDAYKAWYHWDQQKDPNNKAALSVEKALKAKMGTKEYNKYFNKVSDEYSSRGHLKSYKLLEPAEHSKIKSAKMRTGTAKAQKEIAEKMGAKDAAAKFGKIAEEGKVKKGTPTLMRGEKKGDTDSYFGTASLNEAYKKSLAAIKSGDPKQIRKAMSDYAGYHSHHGDHFEDKASKKYRGEQMISLKEKLGKLGLNAFGFKLGKEKGSVSESREKVRGKSTIPVKVNGKDVSVPKSNGAVGKSPSEKPDTDKLLKKYIGDKESASYRNRISKWHDEEFRSIATKVAEAEIRPAAKKRMLHSIYSDYRVVSPKGMEARLKKELSKGAYKATPKDLQREERKKRAEKNYYNSVTYFKSYLDQFPALVNKRKERKQIVQEFVKKNKGRNSEDFKNFVVSKGYKKGE